jgi:hypothetical protein
VEVGAVIEKTLGRCFWFVLALALSCPAVSSKVIAGEESQVTISVYNDAEVPADTLRQAEMEASYVFRQSGIEVKWLNCPLPAEGPDDPVHCVTTDFPEHLHLRIVRRSLNLNGITLGISYLSADGIGCYADLFYERAEQIHENSHLNLATILGHVAAHEIGHLLLGTNSHASSGIMRARWESEELASASKGTLSFSTAESRQMRNKLATWHSRGKDDSQIAKARLGD